MLSTANKANFLLSKGTVVGQVKVDQLFDCITFKHTQGKAKPIKYLYFFFFPKHSNAVFQMDEYFKHSGFDRARLRVGACGIALPFSCRAPVLGALWKQSGREAPNGHCPAEIMELVCSP